MRAVLPLALAVLLAAPATAQEPTVPPALEITAASTSDGGPIGLDPAASTLSVAWVYRFSNPASEAATFGDGDVTLAWSLDCGTSGVRLVDPPVTSIPYVPNQGEYRGDATLPVTASPDTPGQVALSCTVEAQASAATEPMTASGSLQFGPMAAFRGEIRVSTPEATKDAGPQKMIRYEVEVENFGNAPIMVIFEPVGAPSGKWQELMPDPLLLGLEETGTVLLNVATPFHNGYVSDDADIVLRATPVYQFDSQLTGPSKEIGFHATAHGWYVPGPSPLLVLAVLALAALAGRRCAD
ncbi:MAG TPA: hypothetical protein VJ874_02335 [Candidatus Thermoplasmatota archaeon]|nr:hypothetical protein [Candidatus Thermoplasmatota archaeon]